MDLPHLLVQYKFTSYMHSNMDFMCYSWNPSQVWGGEQAPPPKDNNLPSDFPNTKAVEITKCENCIEMIRWQKKTRTLWSKCCGPNRSNSPGVHGAEFSRKLVEQYKQSRQSPTKCCCMKRKALEYLANRKCPDTKASSHIFTLLWSATTICTQWIPVTLCSLWITLVLWHGISQMQGTRCPGFTMFHPSLNQVPGHSRPLPSWPDPLRNVQDRTGHEQN